MKVITVFSWGYSGWGSNTDALVRFVDAIERERGQRPPIFVDIRKSRGGRALGFRDGSFSLTVGRRRYHWLRKLGNARIGSKQGGIKIIDPTAVDDLLQIAISAAKEKRRLIFFCHCEYPSRCHRAVVAQLLAKAAQRKGARLTVVEWPGGEPKTTAIDVSEKVIKEILRGSRNRVPLSGPSATSLKKFVGLPWCSPVRLHSKENEIAVICGPALPTSGGGYLPIVGPDVTFADDTVRSLEGLARRLRRSEGYGPRQVGKGRPPRSGANIHRRA